MKSIFRNIIILCFAMAPLIAFSQQTQMKQKEKPKPLTRILFVFDASFSMYGQWQSDVKITIAQRLLSKLLDSLKNVDNLELALRVFGHQKPVPPQDCNDTKLEVPFAKNNNDKIKAKLKSIVPRGTTPIAKSLEAAGDDFPPCDNCRNIIILITDGDEECGGDPCAVSQGLQKKGIALKPFIIGIGKNFSTEYACVGTYFDASNETVFSKVLNVVISQALNSTTAQVNLLDTYGNPTETNVSMSFFDNFSGMIKYDFVHTLNTRGMPDTLVIDPLPMYNLVVYTIPPVKVDSIKLTPGKHTIIPVDAPQGYLKLKTGGPLTVINKELLCIIRQKGKMETINVQTFNQTEKYITGKYDLEVLCLPRIYLNDIDVSQSHTTTVEIPQPGFVTVQFSTNGNGALFQEENNKLKWLYNFRDNTTQELLMLQPGKYRVIFRSKYTNKAIYTDEKSFKVESGASINVKMFQY